MKFLRQAALLFLIPGFVLAADPQVQKPSKKRSQKTHTAAAPSSKKQGSRSSGLSLPDWNGFYGGLNLGVGFPTANTQFHPLPSPESFVNLYPYTLAPITTDILTAGVHFGYNRQFDQFVLGLATDIQSGLDSTQTVKPFFQNDRTPYPGGFLRASEKTNWLGTSRLRAGWAISRFYLYGTGGLAYGSVQYEARTDFKTPGTEMYSVDFNKYKVGAVFGAGAEWAFATQWSANVEYLFYDLGDQASTTDAQPHLPLYQIQYQWKTEGHLFRAGFNYKFF